jgi:predicted pyridoxine 5'-phosphate oxidase superfamily flavin-nucleotide-binding protein
MSSFQAITFTPDVLAAQTSAYGRAYARDPEAGRDALGPEERAFIEARDSFYLATVSSSGWPYVQHRGGPPGFLRALDEHTLAYADLRGNRQLVSVGNLSANDRAALILVDYPARQRLKVLAHATILAPEERPELLEQLVSPERRRRVERIVRLEVVGFEWNCPQEITPRFSLAEVGVLLAERHAKTPEDGG